MKRSLSLFAVLLTLLSATQSFAQSNREPAAIDTSGVGHVHHVATFLGATTVSGSTKFTFGFDYGYRFHDWMSAGVILDFAVSDPFISIVAAGLWFHPIGGVRLVLGPGVEFKGGKQYFLLRAGVGYDWHIGHWSIGPTYNADFVNSKVAHVYGISVGYGF